MSGDVSDLVERLQWLSSPDAELLCDLERINRFVVAGHAAATALEAKDKEIEALRADLHIVEGAFTDVCDELGCKYDNEAALEAVAALKERLSEQTRMIQNDHDLRRADISRIQTLDARLKSALARAETAERELDALSSSHRDLAKRLAAIGREPDEARAAEPTDAQIDAAAEVMWNDRDARQGGPWSSRDKREVVVIQTRATARAALRAARAVIEKHPKWHGKDYWENEP